MVALGAAVQAGLKSRDAALDELVMTDVCPYTLGTEVANELSPGQYECGVYLPIIERNTPIPASRSRTLTPLHDYAGKMRVDIYQGESRQTRDNIRLGALEIPIPRRKAGEVAVEVRYTYDVDGLLECEVKVPETGRLERLVIQESAGTLNAEQIEKRLAELAKLKIHPREEQRNRTLLARADRLYQERLGFERERVGEAISHFQLALESQDPRKVELVRGQLEDFLQQMEGDPYL